MAVGYRNSRARKELSKITRRARQRHAPDAPSRSLSCILRGGAGDAGRYVASPFVAC